MTPKKTGTPSGSKGFTINPAEMIRALFLDKLWQALGLKHLPGIAKGAIVIVVFVIISATILVFQHAVPSWFALVAWIGGAVFYLHAYSMSKRYDN